MRFCAVLWIGALLLWSLAACVEPDLHQECLVNTDCPEGMQCSFENCIPLEDCPEDKQTRCGDQCVVISSDVDHCGSCDPCPPLANAKALSCIQGQCQYQCDAGYRDVDGDLSMAPLGTGCECPPGEVCDTCAEECGDLEVCRDGRCVQVECTNNDPCALPLPTCEGNRVRSWVGTGTCINNACDRQIVETPCGEDQICQQGTCLDTECTEDVDCAAPEPGCEGDTLLTYGAPQGSCDLGACDLSSITQRQDCTLSERRCQLGACVDPCAEVVCEPPAPAYCEGNTRVVPTSNTCQWETALCLVEEAREECPERCHRGYCVPTDTVVIPAGSTTFTTNATNTISRPFIMQQTEVTRELYRLQFNDDPSLVTTSSRLPVNNVTWLQAIEYANLLSIEQRFEFCYTGNGSPLFNPISDCPGWRLPTLQEFFHAYRAGTDTFFYCGEDAECLTDTAHCGPGSDYSEIRQLLPNPWGLYDIAGNVGEWLHDLHGTQPPMDTVDWDGPSLGEQRYLAGGNAGGAAATCSSISRNVRDPEEAGVEAGFRLVRTLHPEP